ncbi:MAG: LysM peptidoglycan-binding domain-containing protein [Bacillota bacterium]
MPEEPLVLTPGMVAAPVGNVQEQLNGVGQYGLVVDNIYGPYTEAACRNFQAQVGLSQTGVVDPATWRRLFDGEPLPAEVLGPAVDPGVREGDPPERYGVEVNLGERVLRLVKDNTVVATYPVAIGKPATPTPVGVFSVLNKALNPGGVFGTRWLGVTPQGVGIHGTNVPASIGLAVSNGCIRMFNRDVEEIFPLLNVGVPVLIVAGAAAQGAGFYYIVEPGETIFLLARRFGTTVAAIMAANDLTSDVLRVGQRLFIPGPIIGGPSSVYIVQPGDTLFGIAQRFGTTVSALQLVNELVIPEAISPGQVLRIPTVPYSPPPSAGEGAEASIASG